MPIDPTPLADAIKQGLTRDVPPGETLAAVREAGLAEWTAHLKPTTPEARMAVAGVVDASIRIDACRAQLRALMSETSSRASRAWDVDRMAEAAALAGKLPNRPEVVARQLQASRPGVLILVQLWTHLASCLIERKGDWTPEQLSTAWDLCGVPRHMRDGRRPFDVKASDGDLLRSRLDYANAEIDRLHGLLENGLTRLENEAREAARTAAFALSTKGARSILRYEKEAWRRYEENLAIAREAAVEVEVEVEEGAETQDVGAIEAEVEPIAPAPVASSRPLNRRARRRLAAEARRA